MQTRETKEIKENKGILQERKIIKDRFPGYLRDTAGQPMTKVIQENAQGLTVSSFIHFDMQWRHLNNVRNKQVWNLSLILLPVSAILLCASIGVSPGAVKNHNDEKGGQEPWEGTGEAADQTQGGQLAEVSRVVNFPGKAVPPTRE